MPSISVRSTRSTIFFLFIRTQRNDSPSGELESSTIWRIKVCIMLLSKSWKKIFFFLSVISELLELIQYSSGFTLVPLEDLARIDFGQDAKHTFPSPKSTVLPLCIYPWPVCDVLYNPFLHSNPEQTTTWIQDTRFRSSESVIKLKQRADRANFTAVCWKWIKQKRQTK